MSSHGGAGGLLVKNKVVYLREIENSLPQAPVSVTAPFLSYTNIVITHLAEWISLRNQIISVLGEAGQEERKCWVKKKACHHDWELWPGVIGA